MQSIEEIAVRMIQEITGEKTKDRVVNIVPSTQNLAIILDPEIAEKVFLFQKQIREKIKKQTEKLITTEKRFLIASILKLFNQACIAAIFEKNNIDFFAYFSSPSEKESIDWTLGYKKFSKRQNHLFEPLVEMAQYELEYLFNKLGTTHLLKLLTIFNSPFVLKVLTCAQLMKSYPEKYLFSDDSDEETVVRDSSYLQQSIETIKFSVNNVLKRNGLKITDTFSELEDENIENTNPIFRKILDLMIKFRTKNNPYTALANFVSLIEKTEKSRKWSKIPIEASNLTLRLAALKDEFSVSLTKLPGKVSIATGNNWILQVNDHFDFNVAISKYFISVSEIQNLISARLISALTTTISEYMALPHKLPIQKHHPQHQSSRSISTMVAKDTISDKIFNSTLVSSKRLLNWSYEINAEILWQKWKEENRRKSDALVVYKARTR